MRWARCITTQGNRAVSVVTSLAVWGTLCATTRGCLKGCKVLRIGMWIRRGVGVIALSVRQRCRHHLQPALSRRAATCEWRSSCAVAAVRPPAHTHRAPVGHRNSFYFDTYRTFRVGARAMELLHTAI